MLNYSDSQLVVLTVYFYIDKLISQIETFEQCDLSSVRRIVQVFFGIWMRHSSWISTNYVEIGSRSHTCLAVPLNLVKNNIYSSKRTKISKCC